MDPEMARLLRPQSLRAKYGKDKVRARDLITQYACVHTWEISERSH